MPEHESAQWPPGWKHTRDTVLDALRPGQEAPSVGRIAHYVTDGQCLAALMVDPALDSTHVGLTVFDPMPRYRKNVPYSGDLTNSTWHWPPACPNPPGA